MQRPESWLQPTRRGLYCVPGQFYVDPTAAGDHARSGHAAVLATKETLAIMAVRYGDRAVRGGQALAPGETVDLNGVKVGLAPAGHILGSAQVVIEHAGTRVVVSGDYKRRPDPTCAAFEVVPCDLFITEATFGLPVFRHPPARDEIEKLLFSVETFPDRTHLLSAYALGKTQRLIGLLREAGYDRPIWLHPSLMPLTGLYGILGVDLGPVLSLAEHDGGSLAGEIVIAANDGDNEATIRPVTVQASGWLGVRARAKSRAADLPLVISDHADWDELTATIVDTAASELWVTHGREDALVHFAGGLGLEAVAMGSVGTGGGAA